MSSHQILRMCGRNGKRVKTAVIVELAAHGRTKPVLMMLAMNTVAEAITMRRIIQRWTAAANQDWGYNAYVAHWMRRYGGEE